jgi:hypothetical protein
MTSVKWRIRFGETYEQCHCRLARADRARANAEVSERDRKLKFDVWIRLECRNWVTRLKIYRHFVDSNSSQD